MPPGTRRSRYYSALDLSGQRVLITGATSGIGRCCAFRFQELNCHLILVGRDRQKLQDLGMELFQECQINNQYGGHERMPELVRLNVEDTERIEELATKIGPVDILINNAGTNLGGDPVNKVKLHDLNAMVFTNYIAPMAFVSAFAPHMKQKGWGHIINICSTAADDVYAKGSVYCSTKAALSAYSTAARHDLVDTPIRVTSISPGLVDTPLHEKKLGSHNEARKCFEGIVPLFPEDVADQIVYAATRPEHVQVADLASYATNQSHSSAKGIDPVARMGVSLGSSQQHSFEPSSEYRSRQESQDPQSWIPGKAQVTDVRSEMMPPPSPRGVRPFSQDNLRSEMIPPPSPRGIRPFSQDSLSKYSNSQIQQQENIYNPPMSTSMPMSESNNNSSNDPISSQGQSREEVKQEAFRPTMVSPGYPIYN